MVMPSTVDHVRKNLDKILKKLLNSETVITELLKEFDPHVAKDFIGTYVNTYNAQGRRIRDGRQIKLVTQAPQENTDLDNLFLIDMGGGRETEEGHSLGNVINSYDNDGKSSASIEHLTLTYNTNDEFGTITTTYKIGELLDIEELNLVTDQIKITNKTIQIDLPYNVAYDLGLIGTPLEVTVKYMPITENDFFGRVNGYDVTETVRVVMMSRNLNTLRIMDILIKAALIIMRRSDKESETYTLGEAEYFDTAPVTENDLPGLPGRVFGRQVEITYRVTYGMDDAVTKVLNSIDLHF